MVTAVASKVLVRPAAAVSKTVAVAVVAISAAAVRTTCHNCWRSWNSSDWAATVVAAAVTRRAALVLANVIKALIAAAAWAALVAFTAWADTTAA